MRIFNILRYSFREHGLSYSTFEFVRATSAYAHAQRSAATIEQIQERIKDTGDLTETHASNMRAIAQGALQSIKNYEEVVVDASIREKLDREMGGGSLAIPYMKKKFEHILEVTAPPSKPRKL